MKKFMTIFVILVLGMVLSGAVMAENVIIYDNAGMRANPGFSGDYIVRIPNKTKLEVEGVEVRESSKGNPNGIPFLKVTYSGITGYVSIFSTNKADQAKTYAKKFKGREVQQEKQIKKKVERWATTGAYKAIKADMHNPDSFKPKWSKCAKSDGDTWIVLVKYTGTNGFGATVQNSVKIKYNPVANTYEIIEIY
ncbi:MAG: hypothetical protein HF978_20865 [Desulfobacteraceae bacterium]|nr:hypothetical protein [Desulfobacteraceae bacterium]MBC2758001.1 hypothetical protein [Desulfobacteraceae bacterium]